MTIFFLSQLSHIQRETVTIVLPLNLRQIKIGWSCIAVLCYDCLFARLSKLSKCFLTVMLWRCKQTCPSCSWGGHLEVPKAWAPAAPSEPSSAHAYSGPLQFSPLAISTMLTDIPISLAGSIREYSTGPWLDYQITSTAELEHSNAVNCF